MTAAFRRRHDLEQVPTYSTNNAVATPQDAYHAFSTAHNHVASLHTMASYGASNMQNPDTRHLHLNHDEQQQQQREDSYSPDDTPTKRQKTHHSSPDQQHEFITDSSTSEAAHVGIQHMDMLPPPDSVHASWQALHEFAQSHASEHGYALSINTTAKNRSRIKLACVCFGQPKNTHKLTAETRVRKNRVSCKTGCKMWIEAKKQEDGTWLLRVGEAQHNHAGRESAAWAVQRKRTWGVVGGRMGVGGVTAKEELAKLSLEDSKDTLEDTDVAGDGEGDEDTHGPSSSSQAQSSKPTHSLDRGGLVWKIVEQEMLRKGGPTQGRDRGVGRTIDVLQARLPGIHIFKRDVYNIRTQIKRARRAAGQQIGDGLSSENEEGDGDEDQVTQQQTTDTDTQASQQQPPSIFQRNESSRPSASTIRRHSHVDSALAAAATAPPPPPPHLPPAPSIHPPHADMMSMEVEQLKRENTELRRLLAEKTNEVKEKTIAMAGLRSQIDLLSSMMMTTGGM
ncbi:hypothetical protein BDW02DRAFT_491531 [Decorospora gaudefroyi]|uniref:FAR1 domain-containing protein n=1 Tax=Decorospora gaudefroyi TaxID=184978 RepID=A0A6A5KNI8_9PLEO|nr:hypothetical protein BDW02DRAFT_491531 [Decorospora gaudefroyi]